MLEGACGYVGCGLCLDADVDVWMCGCVDVDADVDADADVRLICVWGAADRFATL